MLSNEPITHRPACGVPRRWTMRDNASVGDPARRRPGGCRLPLFVVLLAVAWSSPPSAAQRQSAWEATLAAPMKTWLQEALVPGLAMAVIEDGRLAWQGAFGTKNAETGEPVTDAIVFEAASLSKPVFTYAVMKLVDKGALDLDKPLAEYLAGADLNTRRASPRATTCSGGGRCAARPPAREPARPSTRPPVTMRGSWWRSAPAPGSRRPRGRP